MADQSIALDVKAPNPTFDASTPLLAAQNLENQAAIGDYYKSIAKTSGLQAKGADSAFRDQLIRTAAAHALDSGSWDAAMREAQAQGAPEAGQYVGRYTPLLQQRLFESYGGATPGSGTASRASAGQEGANPSLGVGPQANQMDRAFQNASPEQMQTSLTRLNQISDALTTVRDPQSWNDAIAKLQAAGIPQAAQFAGQYSPLKVQQLYASIQPVRQYLQSRVTSSATGLPDPLVSNEIKEAGLNKDLYSVDPYRGTATQITPKSYKPLADTYTKDGQPVFADEQGNIKVPGTVNLDQAARRIEGTENATGNPAARNPLSSAMGNGQFIRSTWLSTIKSARPDLAAKLDDEQLLALRANPTISHQMVQAYAEENAGVLEKAGMPVTSATLAMAHKLGPGGAEKVLSAAPNTPLSSIFSQQVIAANPSFANMTAGQYAQTIARQHGNDPVQVGTPELVHKDQYDKPQLVEVSAKTNPKLSPAADEAGTVQVLAQQDKRSGQWVTANESRVPIESTDAKIIPESVASGGGGRFQAQITRVLTNAHDAVSEIKNIGELPITASTGWFGGAGQAHGLVNAVKANLANTVTSQEVQDFNTSMVGMGKALATLETMGLASTQGLSDQFDKLALKEGDTNLTKLRKLATMRQQVENGLRGAISSPIIGRAQRDDMKGLMTEIQTAVPWTPHDVTMLERSKDPKTTIMDVAKKQNLAPQDQQALDWANAHPNDPRAVEIKSHVAAP